VQNDGTKTDTPPTDAEPGDAQVVLIARSKHKPTRQALFSVTVSVLTPE
jgi:hypothetical protein